MAGYKTKTQKKRAIESILQKASRLYMSGLLSAKEFDQIRLMFHRVVKKL